MQPTFKTTTQPKEPTQTLIALLKDSNLRESNSLVNKWGN